MSVRRSLIAPSEEYKRFDRLYSKFPRAAGRAPPRAGDRQASRPLAHYVHTELKAIQRREHDAWSAAVVTVDEGDGMTWSAMAVERQVRDEAADFECSQITRDVRADGFPQVAAVIQQSRIVALAQSCGMSPKLAALRPRWIAFVALTVLLGGAAATP